MKKLIIILLNKDKEYNYIIINRLMNDKLMSYDEN